MASGDQASVHTGPPYSSQYQMLGETPSIIPDVPLNILFLLLFTGGAVGHAWQFWTGIKRSRKSIPNAAAFAFCITRIFTDILWIVWACYPKSIECEVAALIFGYVGIILLFIVNLIFSRRIVRGQHPNFGWTMLFSVPFTILFLLVVATIICLIVAIVLLFSTHDQSAQRSALVIQRYGATMYAIIGFVPIVVVGLSSLARCLPQIRQSQSVDKFGEGSMRTKVMIVIVTGFLLSLGACYRAGTILAPRVHVSDPQAPYLSKTCFYVFTFTIEFITIFFWLVMRIDRRFYVPDGVWGPHSYAGGFVFAGESGNDKNRGRAGRLSESQRSLAPSESTAPEKEWAGGLRPPPSFTDSNSRISRPSARSQRLETTDSNSDLPLPRPPKRASSRVSRLSERTSFSRASLSSRPSRMSLAESRRQRTLARESTMTWGGVSRETVCDSLGETRQFVPYAGFERPHVSAQVASDVGVAGAEKEMGWDPKTGKWALRPVSRDRETHRRSESWTAFPPRSPAVDSSASMPSLPPAS